MLLASYSNRRYGAGGEEVATRDPSMRWVVGGRTITEPAASARQMGRFETK
jgi:hypothetical protein